jgi:DNA polymerase sigma
VPIESNSTDLQTIIYGSIATGLALEGSDVDIAIRNLKIESKDQCLEEMHKLNNSLSKLPFVIESKEIHAISVPVIKLVFHVYK